MCIARALRQELQSDVKRWLRIHGIDERRVHLHGDTRGWSALHMAVGESVRQPRTDHVLDLLRLVRLRLLC